MSTKKVDAINVEVMKNAFHSIAEEMGVTLIRTALSTNIKDRMDCSTAVYTKDGRLISQAEHVPLHLGLMPSVVQEVLNIFPPETLQDGDAILINDPYISGSHLPDIFMISPVFHEEKLVAITANIAHHVDVGGIAPGSMSVKATEIFHEGLRLSAVRVQKAGVIDDEIIRILAANVRTGEEVIGDIYAQLACNNVGEYRLKELYEQHGYEFVENCMEEILNYSERRLRAAIQQVPNGEYTFEDYLEGDGVSETILTIKASVKVKETEIDVDFTGSSMQAEGPVNSTIGVTNACVYYSIKSLLDPDVPPNDGTYRMINVIAPNRTIVNPTYPAPVSNANANTSQRITDTVLGALASVLPKQSMAACAGTMNGLVIGGFNEKTDSYFSYVETYGGGQGAVEGLDGMDGVHTNMTNTLNTPVEVIEQTYPLLVQKYGLVEDSGGQGKYKGGMGLTREVTFQSDQLEVTLISERQKFQPWGLFGGEGGRRSECLLKHPNQTVERLPPKASISVKKGSTLILRTSGGGGYGPAGDREVNNKEAERKGES